MRRFYDHINWDEIVKEVENTMTLEINSEITNLINKDLEVLNLQIASDFNWLKYYENSFYFSPLKGQILTFKSLGEPI